MPAAQTPAQLLDSIRESGLVPEEALTQALGSAAESHDTDTITQRLVQKQLLTPFQVRALRNGLHKGLRIGPYKLLEQLGKGGMSVVYLAEHEKLRRRVAIKVLPKDKINDPEARERFFREARAVAALDHPNIIKAHDVGEFQGIPYFVMEYVPGTNLKQHLERNGPVPWEQAVHYVVQACRGLQQAHKKGLVHRDIKPSNLLVDDRGSLRILDLGLARSFTKEEDKITDPVGQRLLMGSVDYIAPEQAVGSDHLDVRTDLYSLGCTFFTLVAGKPPFAGSVAERLAQHQTLAPPPLHECRPEVPPELSAVVARLMAKKPDDRYATPADVIAALAPWQGRAPAPKRRAGTDGPETDRTEPLRSPSTGQLKPPAAGNPKAVCADQDLYDAWTSDTRVGGTTGRVDVEVVDAEYEERCRRRRKKKESQHRRRRMLWTAGLGGMVVPLAVLLVLSLFSRFTRPGVQVAAAQGPAAAGQAPAGRPGPAPAPPPRPAGPAGQAVPAQGGRYVKLVHVETGKVLGVSGNSTDAGARAILRGDDGSESQQWLLKPEGGYFKVVNRRSGKVLDVHGNSLEEGAEINQWTEKSHNTDNQLWAWEEDGQGGRFRVRSSGLVLDVGDQGEAVQRPSYAAAKSQLWKLVEVK
jgi:serine/threonine protein kinase